MRWFLRFALVGLAVGLGTSVATARAATITIEPSSQHASFRTATPWPSAPGYTFVRPRLTVGLAEEVNDETYRSALQFDLSAVPAEQIVTRATLKLYWDGTCFLGIYPSGALATRWCATHEIHVHRLLSAWSPTSTPASLSMEATALASVVVNKFEPARWLLFDVTDVVDRWRNGSAENYGFILKRSSEGSHAGGIAPRSATDPVPALRPKLEVTYLPPGSYPYAEALAAGLEVPENDPDLPFCTDDSSPDPGYASADEVENTPEPTEPECQSDVRDGTVTVGAVKRHIQPWHYGGVAHEQFVNQGVRSAFQVTNPTVDHGPRDETQEHVMGRLLVSGRVSNREPYIEAGWGEFSYHADRPIVWVCFDSGTGRAQVCNDYLQKFQVQVGRFYRFRIFDCGTAQQPMRICASMVHRGGWKRIGTWPGKFRCKNPDGSGNCYVENFIEIGSVDSTPHPSLGGEGIGVADGGLRRGGTWQRWTNTAFPNTTVVSDGDPLTVRWGLEYYRFRVCNTHQPGTCESI